MFKDDATLTAKPIIGGNMNYAWEVTDGEQSIFVKQAPEFVAVGGAGASPSSRRDNHRRRDHHRRRRRRRRRRRHRGRVRRMLASF